MADPVEELCDLLRESGARVTFDRGRNITHPCTFCGKAPESTHDLVDIGTYPNGDARCALSGERTKRMAELAIKFFGREVTLRENVCGLREAQVAPRVRLCLQADELALVVDSFRIAPVAGVHGGDVQRAAEILEGIFKPLAALFESISAHVGPVRMALHCPKCSKEHYDTTCSGGTTHRCDWCGHEWAPFDFETLAVGGTSDLAEADVSYFNGGHDGPGWYYWESGNQQDGVSGSFESFELAARHAAQNGFHRVRPPQLARPA